MENLQQKDMQIKAQAETIKDMDRKIESLEKELHKCLPDSGEYKPEWKPTKEGDTQPKEAADLWFTIEKNLTYAKGYYESYSEIPEQVSEDLALLGRIGQEVTFAHLCRKSTSDFDVANAAGQAISDEQVKKVFFFIDRLSSALFSLRDKYIELGQQEEK